MFMFDESLSTSLRPLRRRSACRCRSSSTAGCITVQQIDPAQLQPGEFAQLVRDAVERDGARVVVIDSLNGYLNAMPEERFLLLQLHELLSYLGQHGVATILVFAQHGLLGANMAAPSTSATSPTCVILLRYFEAHGEVRKAISVDEETERRARDGDPRASRSAADGTEDRRSRSNSSAACSPAFPSFDGETPARRSGPERD